MFNTFMISHSNYNIFFFFYSTVWFGAKYNFVEIFEPFCIGWIKYSHIHARKMN